MNKEEKARRERAKKQRRQQQDKDLMLEQHKETCGECADLGLCTEGEVLLNYDPRNIN